MDDDDAARRAALKMPRAGLGNAVESYSGPEYAARRGRLVLVSIGSAAAHPGRALAGQACGDREGLAGRI